MILASPSAKVDPICSAPEVVCSERFGRRVLVDVKELGPGCLTGADTSLGREYGVESLRGRVVEAMVSVYYHKLTLLSRDADALQAFQPVSVVIRRRIVRDMADAQLSSTISPFLTRSS